MSTDFDSYYRANLSLSRMLGVNLLSISSQQASVDQMRGVSQSQVYHNQEDDAWIDDSRIDDDLDEDGLDDGSYDDDEHIEDKMQLLIDREIRKKVEREIQEEYEAQKREAKIEEEDDEWEDD